MSAPGDEPKGASGRKKPGKVVHAHDEFEVDISVDTKASLPQPSEILPDLFADTVEGSNEEATEVLDLPSIQATSPKDTSRDAPVSTSLGGDLFPVFMPLHNGTPAPGAGARPPAAKPKPQVKSTPPPARSTPPPARSARPAGKVPPPPAPFRPLVEDLSSGVFPRPGGAQPLDLALDDLGLRKTPTAGGPVPEPGEVSDPALEPLDIRQFDMSSAQPKKKTGSGQRTGATDFRAEPFRSPSDRMASPQRVVRTVFTFGTREILILALLVLIGAGLWIGWVIYQDYSRQLDLERAEQFRATLEQVKDSALDQKKVKPKDRDIP